MSNPALLDFEDTKAQFHKLGAARRAARTEFEIHKRQKAEAEHALAKRKAERFSFYRTEGKGVAESEILAKGDVASIVLTRDVADTMAKVAEMRIAELEADRAGLNKLSSWSLAIDPAGVNET